MRFGIIITPEKTYEVVEPHIAGDCLCIAHTASREGAEGIAGGYNNPHPQRDPYDFLRRQQRAQNRADLAMEAERRTQADIDRFEPYRPAKQFQPLESLRAIITKRLHG